VMSLFRSVALSILTPRLGYQGLGIKN